MAVLNEILVGIVHILSMTFLTLDHVLGAVKSGESELEPKAVIGVVSSFGL